MVDPSDLLAPTTAAPSHKKVNKEVNAVPDWHDKDNLGGELKKITIHESRQNKHREIKK